MRRRRATTSRLSVRTLGRRIAFVTWPAALPVAALKACQVASALVHAAGASTGLQPVAGSCTVHGSYVSRVRDSRRCSRTGRDSTTRVLQLAVCATAIDREAGMVVPPAPHMGACHARARQRRGSHAPARLARNHIYISYCSADHSSRPLSCCRLPFRQFYFLLHIFFTIHRRANQKPMTRRCFIAL